MKKIICIILICLLYSCDGRDDVLTFQYVVENRLSSKVSIFLYGDSLRKDTLKKITISPNESILFYECREAIGEGVCDPYDGSNNIDITSDFASILFSDGKQLVFDRYNDTIYYNLLLFYRFNKNLKGSDKLFIDSYEIDTADYLLAK